MMKWEVDLTGITYRRRDFVSGDSAIPGDFSDLKISGQDLIDKENKWDQCATQGNCRWRNYYRPGPFRRRMGNIEIPA